MTKSYSKDIQLLNKILNNQQNIKNAIKHFECNQNNLENSKMAFDLCSFYMSQIGEAAKLLTDQTKQSFKYFDADCTKYFRNMIDHVYEKMNRKYLTAYIFEIITDDAVSEIKNRIKFCLDNAKS